VSVSKHQRQHLIVELLEAEPVGSQAQLVALLEARGVAATQATVSRDLDELGAVKIRVAGGETAYALPDRTAPPAPQDQLRRVLGEWAVAIAWSGTLVVVRTPPGSAHVVGAALDRSGYPGIIGTVAGDDTVLVVADEAVGAPAIGTALRQLAGLPETSGAQSAGSAAPSAGPRAPEPGRTRPTRGTEET
jgi:transcriptional regulator of arginine metabolism